MSITHFRTIARVFILVSLCATLPTVYAEAISALSISGNLHYEFSVDGTLREAGSMSESSSPYWWLNSGGYMTLDNDRGKTVHGTLPLVNTWRTMYASANPVDTDGGKHPQNLFRLVSRSTWNNVRIEAQYRINADHFSSSPNRNASNGLLLMSRYQDDGDTLYYAGIRVDGEAVIKRKYKGTYATLASKKIYSGTYVQGGTSNLIPHDTWIGLRSETVTNSDGSVSIRLYVKNPGSAYVQILEARDTSPITRSGYIGMRTDFMDVEFDNFRAEKI